MTQLFPHIALGRVGNLPSFYDSRPTDHGWSVRFVYREGVWLKQYPGSGRDVEVSEELSATLFEAVKNEDKVIEADLEL